MKIYNIIGLLALSTPMLYGALNQGASTSSMKVYEEGAEQLIVYSSVPGLAPSEFYNIRVRSAASNDQWVSCFANITRSLISSVPANAIEDGTKKEHYYKYVRDWSHTYANIEMNSRVEVEISWKNGTPITRAAVHPAVRAEPARVEGGKAYFFIDNPAPITVDVDGEMDETNTGNGYSGPAIHTLSVFANPVIVKPSLLDSNVIVVEPGVVPSANLGTKTTLYFKPGVHNIGRAFKMQSNKKYYIPGDAIVYGSLTTIGVGSVADVKVYGYGSLSGDRIKHPYHDPDYYGYGSLLGSRGSPPASNPAATTDDSAWKMIYADGCTNFRIEGVSVVNPPYHTINLNGSGSGKQTFCHWVKVITWRCNGDGIGSAHELLDCFIRAQDDCTYVKGDRKRCVFWTDVNGAAFAFAGIPTDRNLVIEDCDIIYPRHYQMSNAGGRVFSKRPGQAPSSGKTAVNVLVRNIRITDKFQTLETFHLKSTGTGGNSGGFSGITFENISAVRTPSASENVIVGWSGGTWSNITFDNVNLGGKRIRSVSDLGQVTTAYVTNLTFISPVIYKLTTNAVNGGIILSPSGGVNTASSAEMMYETGSSVTAQAMPNSGYIFTGWTGGLSGSTNPASILMNADKTITATFAVDSANSAPTISNIADLAIDANTNTGAIPFTIGDMETPVASLPLNAASSNTTLVPVANVVFGGTGANRNVTVTPAANQSGAATITLTVTDADGRTTSDSFVLTVVNPIVTVAATDAAAGEPADNGTYTFTRTGDTTAALAVNFTISGTATSGTDYTALGTSVTIAAGQASATQTLAVIDDATVESSETAIVTLASGTGYTVGTPSSATVTIADNDVPPAEALPWTETFTYADGITSHGAPSTWTATNIRVLSNEMAFNNVGADGVFTTGAINISSGPVTVSLKVRGGGGLDVGQDFLRLYKKVDGGAEVQIGAANGPQAAATWTANITSGNSLVLVIRAHVTSNTEYYYFDDLSVTGSAPVLPTVTVAATVASSSEPATNGTFTFTRTGSTAAALTVNYTVSGTATSGTDYTALGTSVTIAAGQASATKTLAVIDDATAESSETAIVTLASNAAYTIGSPSSATVNIADNDTGLPSPWVAGDIGAGGTVSPAGSVIYNPPTWTITGSGADIISTADQFYYVRQSSSGDCSIVARVTSIQNTHAWAKAGVMIRESTATGSPNIFVFVTPTSGVSITWRSTTGGTTNNTTAAVTGQTAPKWLKITRTGNVFTASRSDDGTIWTQVGASQTIGMATTATVGMAVTSHNNSALCTSTMDNVTATP